ncbi:unnamed protein product [Brassica oleracea]
MLISPSCVTFSISSLRFSMIAIAIPAGTFFINCLRKPLRSTTKERGLVLSSLMLRKQIYTRTAERSSSSHL